MSRHLAWVALIALALGCNQEEPPIKPSEKEPLADIVETSERGLQDVARVIAKFEDGRDAILDRIESLGVKNAADLSTNPDAMILARELVELVDHLDQTLKCYEELKSMGFEAASAKRRLAASSAMKNVDTWAGVVDASNTELRRTMKDHDIIIFDDEVGEILESELEKRKERHQLELEKRRKEEEYRRRKELAKQRQLEEDRRRRELADQRQREEEDQRRKELAKQRQLEDDRHRAVGLDAFVDFFRQFPPRKAHAVVEVGELTKQQEEGCPTKCCIPGVFAINRTNINITQKNSPNSTINIRVGGSAPMGSPYTGGGHIIAVVPSDETFYWAEQCKQLQGAYNELVRIQVYYRSRGYIESMSHRKKQKEVWDQWRHAYNKYCESVKRRTLEYKG